MARLSNFYPQNLNVWWGLYRAHNEFCCSSHLYLLLPSPLASSLLAVWFARRLVCLLDSVALVVSSVPLLILKSPPYATACSRVSNHSDTPIQPSAKSFKGKEIELPIMATSSSFLTASTKNASCLLIRLSFGFCASSRRVSGSHVTFYWLRGVCSFKLL